MEYLEYILLFLLSILFLCIFWCINSIKLIKMTIEDIQKTVEDIRTNKYRNLMSKAENLNGSLNSKYNGINSSINSAKNTIIAECKDIMTSQISEQTDLLIDTLDEHHQTLTAIRENLKGQKQQIKTNQEKIIAKFNDVNILINNNTDNISSAVYNSYNSLNASINKNINATKDNENSIKSMNINLNNYLDKFSQIEELYRNLQILYKKILEEESKISKQEQSLCSMVSRHTQIFEITHEMNQTSKEIFEFMKLYLVQSTLDKFKK